MLVSKMEKIFLFPPEMLYALSVMVLSRFSTSLMAAAHTAIPSLLASSDVTSGL